VKPTTRPNVAARTPHPHQSRVVRAAGKEPKDNPRFVITNLKQSPQWIYEKVYCQRGEMRTGSGCAGETGEE